MHLVMQTFNTGETNNISPKFVYLYGPHESQKKTKKHLCKTLYKTFYLKPTLSFNNTKYSKINERHTTPYYKTEKLNCNSLLISV